MTTKPDYGSIEKPTAEQSLDAIWKELTSGSRLTDSKRDAQAAFVAVSAELLALRRIVRRALACGQLEKLEGANHYLSPEKR